MKSSPDTEEIPEFTEEEVERAIKKMKRHKAQGVDGITSDIIKLEGGGGAVVLTYLTNIFNNILKTKQIPDSCHEAKIVIVLKKGDPKDIKNYRPISLLSHSYKIFTSLLQSRTERTLDENHRRRCCSFQRNNKTNGKTLKQSEIRTSEIWLKNTQRKDKVHDKPCRH